MMDWILFCVCLTFIFLCIIFIIKTKRQQRNIRNAVTDPASVLIVVGSGGHTSEILKLMKALGDHYSPRYYVIADTDTMSEHKVREVENEKQAAGLNSDRKIKGVSADL